jgi:hypothetical protein
MRLILDDSFRFPIVSELVDGGPAQISGKIRWRPIVSWLCTSISLASTHQNLNIDSILYVFFQRFYSNPTGRETSSHP